MKKVWSGCCVPISLMLVLAGCSSSAPESQPAPSTSVLSDEVPANWEFPEAGDTTAAVLNPDEECRNGGVVEAFGARWGVAGLIPLELEGSGSLEGVVRFGTLEWSYFHVDGLAVPITHSLEVGEDCSGWSPEVPSGDE